MVRFIKNFSMKKQHDKYQVGDFLILKIQNGLTYMAIVTQSGYIEFNILSPDSGWYKQNLNSSKKYYWQQPAVVEVLLHEKAQNG